MKIKNGFVLREIAGEWVAIAVGERTSEFPGIIALTETSAYVWKQLENTCSVEQLAAGLVSEFDVDYETAKNDVSKFIVSLKEEGLIENE